MAINTNSQRSHHNFAMCIICAMSRVGARRSRHLLGACCQQAGLCAPAAPIQASQRSFSSLPETVASPASNVKDGFVSHPSLLNENLLKTQYAVRGELYAKAMELAASGRELIFTNVPNAIPSLLNDEDAVQCTARGELYN